MNMNHTDGSIQRSKVLRILSAEVLGHVQVGHDYKVAHTALGRRNVSLDMGVLNRIHIPGQPCSPNATALTTLQDHEWHHEASVPLEVRQEVVRQLGLQPRLGQLQVQPVLLRPEFRAAR